MESTIKIDFADNGQGLEPEIRVRISNSSEDPRDKLLQAFFERLQGTSSWLAIRYDEPSHDASKGQRITISPIVPSDLGKLVEEVQECIKYR